MSLRIQLPFRHMPKAARAYLVGGTVRDMVASVRPVDYDIAVADDPERYARELAQANGGHVVHLGKPGMTIYRVASPAGIADVAAVAGGSIEADLHLRDFTINAMALAIDSWDLIDPHGGQQDLADGMVRMVSPAAFDKDPVRLLRAFRMAAAMRARIAEETLSAIRRHAPRIGESAGERVRDEWLKILACADSAGHIRTMHRLGLLPALFPELLGGGLKSASSPRFLDTYAALASLLEQPPCLPVRIADRLRGHIGIRGAVRIKCAGLFLAMGPGGPQEAANRWAAAAAAVAGRLRFSNLDRHHIDTLIRWYPQVLDLFAGSGETVSTRRARIRFFMACTDRVPALMLCFLAAAAARPDPETRAVDGAVQVLTEFFGRFERLSEGAPLITGEDLIRSCRLSPSPLFKRILTAVEEEHLAGTLSTRADALQFVQDWLASDAS